MNEREIHITVPGLADDPRFVDPPPGIVVHYTPPLHPDDLAVVDGIPCTSVARTLVDCAEEMTIDELRELFRNAGARDCSTSTPSEPPPHALSGVPPSRCFTR